MEIYRGPSMLNGDEIVVITTHSKNRKTGDMIQVWILDANQNPLTEMKSEYSSICGDCKHRGKTCYVAVHHAPNNVWRKWNEGGYEPTEAMSFLKGKTVRLGAYGDPVAVPLFVIKDIVKAADGHTGYTHQWKLLRSQPYRRYIMASVDSPAEYQEAKAMGWRTFRVKNEGEEIFERERICPAAYKKSTCKRCQLCSGTGGRGNVDIAIDVHGLDWKIQNFKRTSLTLV